MLVLVLVVLGLGFQAVSQMGTKLLEAFLGKGEEDADETEVTMAS